MTETSMIWFSWAVLVSVLTVVASGRISMDLAAWCGLMLLAVFRIAPGAVLFSGLSHPALITIVAVMIMSEGIAASGALAGLGLAISKRTRTVQEQILSVSLFTSLMSAFMNNVGAVGLILPTAVRMADRAKVHRGVFGMPLAFASILGGTMTLIGSAPNIIVSSYLFQQSGIQLRMFDFLPHGLAIILSAILLWQISLTFGFSPMRNSPLTSNPMAPEVLPPPVAGVMATPTRRWTVIWSLLGIVLVSYGFLTPAVGFSGVVILFVLTRVMTIKQIYRSIELPIVFFLSGMIGIGQTMEHIGGLDALSRWLLPQIMQLSPVVLIAIILGVAMLLSNAINNAAAAVVMVPIAYSLAIQTQAVSATALLMAVAAGANLALILPTHQASLLVLSKAPFSFSTYIRSGLALSLITSLAAIAAIILIWN